MDNLFTLIVIIIAVVSFASKIKAKQKAQQGATPPSGGGWITKLNNFLADMQNRMEQQAKGNTTGGSGWGQLMDGPEAVHAQADTLEDLSLEEDQSPLPAKAKPAIRPVRAKQQSAGKRHVTADTPRRSSLGAEKRSPACMAVNRADLRKAVIWSEILGPPVALREQRDGRR